MDDGLVDRIEHVPLDHYIHTSREHGKRAFLEAHRGAVLLVSKGPVEKDNPLQTQRFAFGTCSGSLGDLEKDIQYASRAVYVIQWGNIDWSSPAFYTRKIWIGRAPNVSMRITMPSVSKNHGYLRRDEADCQMYYKDIGSSNGSKVDGRMLRGEDSPELPVGPGSEINLGGVELTVISPEDFFDAFCK
ncbi:FHA domain-containing protein [Candidatus Woesearchaeota archaeon]|nr:FHA domain-containing protein [Candidatus Woesearchaeota archaeon]